MWSDTLAEWTAPTGSYTEAIGTVLAGLAKDVNPRMCTWCAYPALLQKLALRQRTSKSIDRLVAEERLLTHPSRHWVLGVPRFRVALKTVPHLSVDIEIYVVASWQEGVGCWWSLAENADYFDFPLALLDSLPKALKNGELEAGGPIWWRRGRGRRSTTSWGGSGGCPMLS